MKRGFMEKDYLPDSLEILKKDYNNACKNNELSFVKFLFSHHIYKEHINDYQVKNDGFIAACESGNLDIIRFLLNSKNADINYENNLGFKSACEFGQLEVVKYLLYSEELKEVANIYANGQEGLLMAAYKGRLDVVKFLLETHLKKDNIQARLLNTNEAFKMACIGGHIDLVEYLMSNNEIPKIDPNYQKDAALIKSCYYGNFKMVKYLLESDLFRDKYKIEGDDNLVIVNACLSKNTDLVEYLLISKSLDKNASVHVQNDMPFIFVAENNMLNVLQVLIFDKQIKKTYYIRNYLEQNNGEASRLFGIRDLKEKLSFDLTVDNELTNKVINKV